MRQRAFTVFPHRESYTSRGTRNKRLIPASASADGPAGYTELALAVGEIAERIRALGAPAGQNSGSARPRQKWQDLGFQSNGGES
jgi:hypothetical protein